MLLKIRQRNVHRVFWLCSPLFSVKLMISSPGHILHNTDRSGAESKILTAKNLMKMANHSAGDISPPQIFSPQYHGLLRYKLTIVT
jgi:hypothetical protein